MNHCHLPLPIPRKVILWSWWSCLPHWGWRTSQKTSSYFLLLQLLRCILATPVMLTSAPSPFLSASPISSTFPSLILILPPFISLTFLPLSSLSHLTRSTPGNILSLFISTGEPLQTTWQLLSPKCAKFIVSSQRAIYWCSWRAGQRCTHYVKGWGGGFPLDWPTRMS